MSSAVDREAAKRRMMFIAGEDFYFLAYTLLVILDALRTRSSAYPLEDSRKLSYVADILGSDSDLRLVLTRAPLSDAARARLSLLHDRAVARRLVVDRLVHALVLRGLVQRSTCPGEPDRVHLVETATVRKLLDSDLFVDELRRMAAFRRSFPHLRTMSLATLKDRLFADKGVSTWAD